MTQHGTRVHVYLDAASLANLDAARGAATRSAYLRLLLTADVQRKESGDLSVRTVPAAPDPIPDTPFDKPAPVVVTKQKTTTGRHFHRKYELAATRFEKGVEMKNWVCECGLDLGWSR